MELFKVDNLTPYLTDLVTILIDAVDNGASIGFQAPLSEEEAQSYWESVHADIQQNSRQIVLVRHHDQIIGTIQLEMHAKANALHRAGVEKWMVLSGYQGQGFGSSLLQAAEKLAAALQIELLMCDTRCGDLSETLLHKFDWQKVGTVPNYSRTAMATYFDCAIYYKEIEPSQELYV